MSGSESLIVHILAWLIVGGCVAVPLYDLHAGGTIDEWRESLRRWREVRQATEGVRRRVRRIRRGRTN